jgi:hypothetical protein
MLVDGVLHRVNLRLGLPCLVVFQRPDRHQRDLFHLGGLEVTLELRVLLLGRAVDLCFLLPLLPIQRCRDLCVRPA